MTIFREVAEEDISDVTARDRRRHIEKVKQSIRDNIADIIAEESIIGESKDKLVKIPIRSIKEYRFIFGQNHEKVAQGSGKEQIGDIFEQSDDIENVGDQPGDQPGADMIETEITLEELLEIMFDDLNLPFDERKKLKQLLSQKGLKRSGHRRKGIRPRLDKKLTAKLRVKRRVASGVASNDDFPFHDRDLRYYFVKPKFRESVNAVVICIMDTSGSMSSNKKYLARSFYFLLYNFIRAKYQEAQIVFIAHHTEAKEVSEKEFFHKVESGGTYISSGYMKALEIIQERYHPDNWNIYVFHCSDGDNYYSDNEKALSLAEELCKLVTLFGYGEIKPYGAGYYSDSMLELFKAIKYPNFFCALIEKKEDLYPTLKQFLSKEVT